MEQRVVSAFQSSRPELAGHKVIPLAPPQPDFGAIAGDQCIGIELTELVAQRRLRQLESEYEGILQSARSAYDGSGAPAAHVTVYWNYFQPIRKVERTDLSARVATFVLTNLPAPSAPFAMDRPPESAIDWPDPRIVRIAIARSDEGEVPSAEWIVDDTESPGRAQVLHIQARIDGKASRPAKYPQSYAACWLVLWQSEGAPSSDFSLAPSIYSHTYTSSFDRVFLFRSSSGQSHELHLR